MKKSEAAAIEEKSSNINISASEKYQMAEKHRSII